MLQKYREKKMYIAVSNSNEKFKTLKREGEGEGGRAVVQKWE